MKNFNIYCNRLDIYTAVFLGAFFLGMLFAMPTGANAQAAKHRWPMGTQTSIQNYYDHNSSSGYHRYDCSATGGYNGHKGTDTGASKGTPIYGSATGGLYYRYDSCPLDGPNNTAPTCGGGFGNHVRVEHNDSKVTIYAHMKYGTPSYGISFICSSNPGTKMGEVGSSGYSSYNHLHFELWSDRTKSSVIDPFSGSCSQTTSYWVNQNGGSPTTSCQ